MITIVAKFDVRSDCVDAFTKLAVNVTRETKKERGNLSYRIYQSRADKTKFTFIEEWQNDTAIEQHNYSKHFTAFMDGIKPLIAGEVQIEQLTSVVSVFM